VAGQVARQPGAFQRFEVGAQVYFTLPAGGQQPLQVGVNDVEVDEQLRRIECKRSAAR